MSQIELKKIEKYINLNNILIEGKLLSKKDISLIYQYAENGVFNLFPKNNKKDILENIAFHLQNEDEEKLVIKRNDKNIEIIQGLHAYIASILRKDKKINIYINEKDEVLNNLLEQELSIIDKLDKKLSLSEILNNHSYKDETYYLNRLLVLNDELEDIPQEMWENAYFCKKVADESVLRDGLDENLLFHKGFIDLINDRVFPLLWDTHYSALYSHFKNESGGFISSNTKKKQRKNKKERLQMIHSLEKDDSFNKWGYFDDESFNRYKEELLYDTMLEFHSSGKEFSIEVKEKAKVFFETFENLLKDPVVAMSLLKNCDKSSDESLIALIVNNHTKNHDILKKALLLLPLYKIKESNSLGDLNINISNNDFKDFLENNINFCLTELLNKNSSIFKLNNFKTGMSNIFNDSQKIIDILEKFKHENNFSTLIKMIYSLPWQEEKLKNDENIVSYCLLNNPSLYEDLSAKNREKIKYLDIYLNLPTSLIDINYIPLNILKVTKDATIMTKCLNKKPELINFVSHWVTIDNLINHNIKKSDIKNLEHLSKVIMSDNDIEKHKLLLNEDIGYYHFVDNNLKNNKYNALKYIEEVGNNFTGMEKLFFNKKFCQEALLKNNLDIIALIPSVFWEDVSFSKEVLIKIDNGEISSKIIKNVPILKELLQENNEKGFFEKILLKHIVDYDLSKKSSKKSKMKI